MIIKKHILRLLSSIKAKGSFAQNTTYIFSSKAVGFLLTLIFTPILSRIYTPESYGLLSVFMLFVNIYISIGSLGYVEAMSVTKNRREFYILFWIALAFMVILSIPFIAMAVWINELIQFTTDTLSLSFLVLIWAGLLIFSVFLILTRWPIFRNKFRFQSKAGIAGAVMSRLIPLLLGISFGAPKFGLILGELAGNITQNALYTFRFIAREFRDMITNLNFSEIRSTISKFSTYPKYFPAQNLLLRLSSQLPIFVIIGLYDLGTLGKYTMAIGLITIPINLLAHSLYSVFTQKFNTLSGDSFKNFIAKITKIILGGLFIPAAGLVVLTPLLLSIFLGNQWKLSGEIASLLSLYIPHQILGICFSSLLQTSKKQKLLFLMSGLNIIFVGVGLWIGHQTGGILNLVAGFSLAVLSFNFLKIHYIIGHFESKGKFLNFLLFIFFVSIFVVARILSN